MTCAPPYEECNSPFHGIKSEDQTAARVAALARANADISRPSAGVKAERCHFVLVRESDSNRHREGRGMKLQHELVGGRRRVADRP